MEKLELTASELMSELNWKKSKVYYWINSNKFETIERETGKNVLITREQIERLRSKTVQENFEQFETSSENSKEVQDVPYENVTKHYKNVSNNSELSEKEYFLESLNTIKVMHQTSIQNFNYSMKLLTDGKNELEDQYLELKANNRTMSEKVEQKENEIKKLDKSVQLRNYIIIVLIALFVMICVLYFSELSKMSKDVQTSENVGQKIEQVQANQTVSKSSKVQESPKKQAETKKQK